MPVINPIWFYLMSVCGAVKVAAIVCAFVSAVLGVACVACMICGDEGAFTKRFWKRCVAAFCISAAIAALCPTSKTLEKMLIAQSVTYERVEQATDVVSDVYEDIMNLFAKDRE